MSSPEAVNRLVVFGDTCGSGQMNMAAKRRTREGMYGAFAKAFASVGVNPGEVHQEDRGDGILAALDPGVPSSPMVGGWLGSLYESLREYNSAYATRLRMRVAMHMGPVADDGKGLVGRAVDVTCRLCDSDAAKETIARADGYDLLHVVSDWLYVNVVAEGGRYIEPDHYRQARVGNKETDELAWFRVPGLPEPPTVIPSPPRRTGGGTAATGAGPRRPMPPQEPPPQQPPHSATGLKNHFDVAGDSQYFEGGEFHHFTGIRKDRPYDSGSEGAK